MFVFILNTQTFTRIAKSGQSPPQKRTDQGLDQTAQCESQQT